MAIIWFALTAAAVYSLGAHLAADRHVRSGLRCRGVPLQRADQGVRRRQPELGFGIFTVAALVATVTLLVLKLVLARTAPPVQAKDDAGASRLDVVDAG
ncbi:hypothetical protein [Arthrobacter sp. ISL-65]|uniref:hypothetical protein n=1 Tax=Arthrobacter sp. ISL-65 TaxID=2819112 RepID=UPI001BE691DE|nr:hypothetical protein [Arthrobacter sp. ISL-65]MBT2547726.1 hypothetical protein [Arthrobacter sp. ISL-65]